MIKSLTLIIINFILKYEQLEFLLIPLIKYRERVRYLKKSSIGSASFVMDVESLKTLFHSKTAEIKEPHTIRWIDDFLETGDTVYDVGANVGVYSLYIAAKFGLKVKVLSFEPEALNFAQLNRNIYSNGFNSIISAYCFAIANKTEIGTLNLESWRIGGTVHQFNRSKDHLENTFSPAHKQGVFGVSLDDLVYVYGLPKPNHIKIDVDGIEKLVLQGSEDILKDLSLKSVHIEITEDQENKIEEIVKIMQKNNFYIYQAVESASISVITTADYTFVREGPSNDLKKL